MMRLDQITIAVGDEDRMQTFYSQLCGAPLTAIDCGTFTLYRGQLAPGLSLQLCPKAVAGIAATQNIHQLRFVVPDVAHCLALAVESGGQVLEELSLRGGREHGSVRDPDGNSIEFIAAE